MDLSRAEGGELELTPQPAFLNEIMDDVQALWTPRAAQDGVSLMAGYDGDPDLAAEIDVVRLKQVFNNLIGNALKYARNGVVEAALKAVAIGDSVRLEGARARQRQGRSRAAGERLRAVRGGLRPRLGAGPRHLPPDRGADGRAHLGRAQPGKGSTFGFEIDRAACGADPPGRGRQCGGAGRAAPRRPSRTS